MNFFLFLIAGNSEDKGGRIATLRNTAEIGLSKNIRNDPKDKINDRRKCSSNIGPKINANMKGADSYSNFFIRKPTIPKKIINPISNTVFLIP